MIIFVISNVSTLRWKHLLFQHWYLMRNDFRIGRILSTLILRFLLPSHYIEVVLHMAHTISFTVCTSVKSCPTGVLTHYTCVFGVLTVMLVPTAMSTLWNKILCPCTVDVIKQDGSNPAPKVCTCPCNSALSKTNEVWILQFTLIYIDYLFNF